MRDGTGVRMGFLAKSVKETSFCTFFLPQRMLLCALVVLVAPGVISDRTRVDSHVLRMVEWGAQKAALHPRTLDFWPREIVTPLHSSLLFARYFQKHSQLMQGSLGWKSLNSRVA